MRRKKKANYNNVKEVIRQLNSSQIPYLVLRNYDNLLKDEIYMSGHGDIDLLCANSVKLAKAMHAIDHPAHIKNGKGNGTHYILYIDGVEVSLDLRHVGDAYYCKRWEEDLLKRRRKHNGFFVPSKKDYFYSLIYHAIFQKPVFSNDYQTRLKKMGQDLGLSIKEDSLEFYVELLEKFMKENNYIYEYPKDKHVPLKTKHIQDDSLFKMHHKRYFRHFFFETKVNVLNELVRIKHCIKKTST